MNESMNESFIFLFSMNTIKDLQKFTIQYYEKWNDPSAFIDYFKQYI